VVGRRARRGVGRVDGFLQPRLVVTFVAAAAISASTPVVELLVLGRLVRGLGRDLGGAELRAAAGLARRAAAPRERQVLGGEQRAAAAGQRVPSAVGDLREGGRARVSALWRMGSCRARDAVGAPPAAPAPPASRSGRPP
jgi:hypothetical protein